MGRFIAVLVMVCSATVSALTLATVASGSPCDGPDCMPNINRHAREGTPCTPSTRYVFGVDPTFGYPMACLSSGKWVRSADLVGVRDQGARCYGNTGLSQSPTGVPLACDTHGWIPYYVDLPQP